jgi:hypothetical protein
MVFCYAGEESVFAAGEDGRALEGYALGPDGLTALGCAMTDRAGALVVRRGAYEARHVGAALAAAVGRTGEFALEAYVRPDRAACDKGAGDASAGDIVWFGTPKRRDLALTQRRGKLLLALRTCDDEPRAVTLFDLDGREPFHLLVTCAAGELVAYRNGREAFRAAWPGGTGASPPARGRWRGGPGGWRAGRLLFGSDGAAKRDWRGRLEGVALFARAVGAEEARRRFREQAARARLRAAPVVRIRARLLERSQVPGVLAADPYYRLLAFYRYRVEWVIDGPCQACLPPHKRLEGREISVAHWVILRGAVLPFADAPVGSRFDLVLEHLADNPKLEWDDQVDSLSPGSLALPHYYDAGGLSVTYEAPRGPKVSRSEAPPRPGAQ